MNSDKVISEARARIIWGESSLAVRDFLVSNGVPSLVADNKVREFERERASELRKIGLRNLVIGIVLTGMAGVTLYQAYHLASPTSGIARIYAMVVLIGFYGLWKLVRGMAHLLRPRSEHRSIPDVIEADPLE